MRNIPRRAQFGVQEKGQAYNFMNRNLKKRTYLVFEMTQQGNTRFVDRTLSNIYDEDFLRKKSTAFTL